MRSTEPPKMAAWLLIHFGCSTNNDAVLGDLAEHYHNGQTATWFWKQTFSAIVRSLLREIGANKLVAFYSVAAGWTVLALSQYVRFQLFKQVWHRYPLGVPTGLSLLMPLLAVFFIAGSGWIVGRSGGAHRTMAVLSFAGSYLLLRSVQQLILAQSFRSTLANIYPDYRIAFIVQRIFIDPLFCGLLALLILKAGGLLSASKTRHPKRAV